MNLRRWLTLLLLFLFVPLGAQSTPELKITFVPLENRTAGNAFPQYALTLATLVRSSFQSRGFQIIPITQDAGGGYLFRGFYVVEGEDLIFQGSVEHLATKRIVASDMASVFSGLTALDLLRELVDNLAATTKEFHTAVSAAPLTAVPLPEPLVFKGQDGTRVFWAGGEQIGTVTEGILEAPYYPFPSDGHLEITLEKEGFHPRNMLLNLTADSREFSLPELTPLVKQEVVLTTALGRLLGAGLAYHYYLEPNNLFGTVESHIYAQYSGTPKATPQVHTDFWLGAGYYLFTTPDSEVRLYYELLMGVLMTAQIVETGSRLPVDLVVMPLGLTLEYRGLRDWPLQLGVRFPYSLGVPGGLLPRSWLFVASTVPSVSLGVAKRW